LKHSKKSDGVPNAPQKKKAKRETNRSPETTLAVRLLRVLTL